MNRGFIGALCLGVTFALLAGCGGSQPPIGKSVLAHGAAAQLNVHRATGSSGDLLYVLTNYGVTIVSYPELQIVAKFPQTGIGGICSDPNNGNVFIPEGDTVLEYSHGGTTPIATLSVPSGYSDLQGCSVDPTTGNLAVTSYFGPLGRSGLFVFPSAQGDPIVYNPKPTHLFLWTVYDNAGNLYVPIYTGRHGKQSIVELPAGQSKLTFFRFKTDLYVGKLQWDGTNLTIDDVSPPRGSTLHQLQLVNGRVKVGQSVPLLDAGVSAYCLFDGTAFQAYWKIKKNKDAAIALWPYPQGGKPAAILYGVSNGKRATIEDMTMSVAPNH